MQSIVSNPLLSKTGMISLTAYENENQSLVLKRILETSLEPTGPKHDPFGGAAYQRCTISLILTFSSSVAFIFYLLKGVVCINFDKMNE